jgi:L-ascorbate metabolism protein UlaG (beta-lactamase superfamily)
MRLTTERVFLKSNVAVEPLYNQWYAWSCLISPATAAMFIANSHLKIMQSFVAAPQVHIAALKNPAMIGGPFINYGAERVGDVRSLLDQTVRDQAHMLELADAVKNLDKVLGAEANGGSLEPLYEKVPRVLKGFVELTYDLNNHPSIRFIEGLLYRSRYANESAQSVSLSLITGDERSFAFSTPRLEDEAHLSLKIPFRHEGLDALFRMKEVAQPFDGIRETLGVGDEDAALFSTFFTEEPPRPRPAYTDAALRIRYFGHACLLFEAEGLSILCDPVISYDDPGGIERYTFADLPDKIDYVLITHNHQDHCMFETLLQLRHKVENVIVPKNNGGGLADPSLKLVMQNIGFKNVIEIDEMETVAVKGSVSITGLPFLGEHTDLNVRSKIAYLIEARGQSILCAADSNNIEPQLYEHIHKIVGDVDMIFIGMECDGAPLSWLYGPLMTQPLARKLDQSRRLCGSNYERGISIINRFNAGRAYVYAMGQEPWLTYLTSIKYTDESTPIVESNKLVEDCRRRGLSSERLFGRKEIVCS